MAGPWSPRRNRLRHTQHDETIWRRARRDRRMATSTPRRPCRCAVSQPRAHARAHARKVLRFGAGPSIASRCGKAGQCIFHTARHSLFVFWPACPVPPSPRYERMSPVVQLTSASYDCTCALGPDPYEDVLRSWQASQPDPHHDARWDYPQFGRPSSSSTSAFGPARRSRRSEPSCSSLHR